VVDLYFVARLGEAAIAGVSSAGTAGFVIMALTQMLGVGTVALVSHAAVARTRPSQPGVQSVRDAVGDLRCADARRRLPAERPVRASGGGRPGRRRRGDGVPLLVHAGLALQFALVAMGSALRGTGIVQPTMIVQMLTVILNTVLAPVLIAGWGTHHPLGAAGAGLASSISVALGVLFLWIISFGSSTTSGCAPICGGRGWRSSGAFSTSDCRRRRVFHDLRDPGRHLLGDPRLRAGAQAGFGVGGRVMQALFLPVMAIAFAASPVAGQNFGAGQYARVRETFRRAAV